MNQLRQPISPERKGIYYAGIVIGILGLISFLSAFVSAAIHFGEFDNFLSTAKSMALRSVGGMVMMIVGGILMSVGARGLAGAGVILDPDKARKDLEPWNKMAGGMVDDAVSQIGIAQKIESHLDQVTTAPQTTIKVRCPKCKALNDEQDKFCGQCGSAI